MTDKENGIRDDYSTNESKQQYNSMGVQKDSLADKAGLQIGDTVTEFSGRVAKGMPLQEARTPIDLLYDPPISQLWDVSKQVARSDKHEKRSESTLAGPRNVPITLGTPTPSSAQRITPTNKVTTGAEGKIYGPVHVDTINTYSDAGYPSSGSGGGHCPMRNTPSKSAYQDSRPRVLFQHSPRTERQLSPHATVRHLQYNSPMNLYSPHSAAEQYIQQTEEEGQSAHDKSPSMQSASFKRIARACGTPVD
ncbi:unnamed protein product [Litomosoides sigmodontis]|uniref:Zasp-like motif domain-containing protein n=1 Tax=Litomosoides sigmodontis TaxID=42156 RepID=A0A3P6VEW8_LITSI|nr:unnamed protein product [Litomosoides sigmodontis]